MALVNPVPAFNFQVFLFDARDEFLPQSASEAVTALGGLAIGVGKSVLFGSFSEVSGLNQEIEIEEFREGGNNRAPLKFMKWGRYANLTFRSGVTFNTDLTDWSYQVLNGSRAPIRKNGIVLLNDGPLVPGVGPGVNVPGLDTTPVALWYFSNGLPERIQGPNLNAMANEIAIETLEIAHEGLMRLGPGLIPGIGEALTSVGL